jgi:tetratricopeptide (TPR) repeat protein
MEWAQGESLLTLPPPRDLEALVALVDRVLEALAHAHARGVIHRDLKPANILVLGTDDDAESAMRRGAVKLVDFGIARIFEDEGEKAAGQRGGGAFSELSKRGIHPETRPYEVKLEGTPRYMAPELYKGREGLISPANDIYAVGVLLYELLTGKALFEVDSELALMALQLQGKVPNVPPRAELGLRTLPVGLLERMLAPDPMDRIDHATLVRRALLEWFRRERGVRSSGKADSNPGGLRPAGPWRGDDPLQETRSAPSHASACCEPELNLLAWRPMPLVGRAREQARLWQAAEQVSELGRANVLWLEGDPGVGKSHLTRWMVETAGEARLVQPMWCGLASRGTMDAVRGVVERHLMAVGVEEPILHKRLWKLLSQRPLVEPAGEVERLMELLRPTKQPPQAKFAEEPTTRSGSLGRVLFDVGEESSALLGRLLQRASASCPVLVVFDGLEPHNADGVLRMIEHVVRAQRTTPFPVLFLVTAVRGVLEQLRGPAREALDFLWGVQALERIALEPLERADVQLLLSRFEVLQAEARDQILERAEGNPLFAVELAEHALRGGAGGMPESIAELWRRRVALAAMGSEIGEVALHVLELCAVLGPSAWLELVKTAWMTPFLRQMHRFEGEVLAAWEWWVEQRILVEDGAGKASFRHSLLRESVLADLEGSERLRHYHEASAWARRRLDLARTPQDWLRLAEHLTSAARPQEAWSYALPAAQALLGLDLREAQRAWSLSERILDLLRVGDEDARRELVEVGSAQLAWRLGDPEEVHRRACSLCDRGRRTGSLRQLGMGELLLAELALYDAAPQAAGELYDRALSRFETCDDALGRAEAHMGLARLALRGGRNEVAVHNLRKAEALAVSGQGQDKLGPIYMLLGQSYRGLGEVEPASRYFAEALRCFERGGDKLSQAKVLCELGQIAQAKGDIKSAVSLFQDYLEQAEALGDIPSLAQARANLGQAKLQLGKTEQAIVLLEQAKKATADLNDKATLAVIQVILGLALALQERWGEASTQIREGMEAAAQLELYDIDVAESLEAVVLLPQAASKLRGVFPVWVEQVVEQWRNLGQPERARRTLQRLARA